MLGNMKDKFCLKDMVKFFIKTQPDVKKFWKKKSKELTNKYELQNVNKKRDQETDEEVIEEEVEKKKPQQKLLNKKQIRANESYDSDEESVKQSSKNKNTTASQNVVAKNGKNGKVAKKVESSDEDEEENFVQSKPIYTNGNSNNTDKTPFKRIDNSLKEILPQTLQDNSYESFMNKTGENYGHQANEKLKFTKGRDFKKEKTKFKNKTAFGGLSISTAVRSIVLDDD